MIPLCLHFLMGAAVLFSPFVIPLADPQARILLAPRPDDGGALILVAQGRVVTIHNPWTNTGTRVTLPEGVSAWEFCDLEGDGSAELLAVRGRDLLLVPVQGSEASDGNPPRTLFSQDNLYAGSSAPFPQVLTVQHAGQTRIALPSPEGMLLFDPGGKLTETIEQGKNGSLGQAFGILDVTPPLCAPPDGLEMRITASEGVRAVVMPAQSTAQPESGFVPVSARQASDALTLPTPRWPWFPLHAANQSAKAHFALADGISPNTMIAVAGSFPATSTGESTAATKLGPRRRYPGSILLPDGPLPDFNGDGWTDLMLWRVPLPTPTLDALSHTALQRHLTAFLTAHLFNPSKRRFEPQADGLVELHPPVHWLLSNMGKEPLRHVLLRDFDGDGRTDFACCTGPRDFQVWLKRDKGFRPTADFVERFPDDVDSTAFVASLDPGTPDSIGFRTKNAVHVLWNRSTALGPTGD